MGKRVNLKSIIRNMTLKEKLAEITQIAGNILDKTTEQTDLGPLSALEFKRDDLYAVGSLNVNLRGNRQNEIQDEHIAKNRNHIPCLIMQDVIHGYKTIYPVPLAMSCSFDMDLVQRCSAMAAKECAANGTHITIGPMIDVCRDPRWGRVVESAGEDPFLTSKMAEAQISGFQGDNLKYDTEKVGVCLKHFCGYGFSEAGRDYNSVDMSEIRLYNIVLPPFLAGIRAGALSVMTAFNTLNGTPMTANKKLLKGVLRDKFGFDGLIVSDASSAMEIIEHGFAPDLKTAAKLCIEAGLDIDMFSPVYFKGLEEAVQCGMVEEELIDDAVFHVLKTKERLNLFQDPHRSADDNNANKIFWCEEHRAIAKEAVLKTCVLLKNDGILPFDRHKKTAVIGPFADEKNIIGAWAIESNADKTVTVLNGCRKLSECVFAKGCSYEADCNDESGFEAALHVAAQAENVILCVGEFQNDAGEAKSKTNLHIPHIQKKLIHKIVEVNPNTAVILFNGRPLLVDEIEEISPAVLEVWQPGIEGGNGIAELLFGLHSPCGKLSMTFPRNIGQIPIYYNHLNTGRPQKGENKSFCSYYIDSEKSPLHPFGFGLSYAEFSISSIKLDKTELEEGGKLTASVIISNKSDIAARTIVQLYIRDMVASVCRPVKELKNFIPLDLCANEDKIVSFEIVSEMLGFYDAEGTYKIEEGLFELYIGFDSATENCTRFYYMGKLHERRI